MNKRLVFCAVLALGGLSACGGAASSEPAPAAAPAPRGGVAPAAASPGEESAMENDSGGEAAFDIEE